MPGVSLEILPVLVPPWLVFQKLIDTLKLSINPALKSFLTRKAAGLSHISPLSVQLLCTFVFYLQKPGVVKAVEVKIKSKKP